MPLRKSIGLQGPSPEEQLSERQAAQLAQVRLILNIRCRALPAPRGKPESSPQPNVYSHRAHDSMILNPLFLISAAWFPYVCFSKQGVQVLRLNCAELGWVLLQAISRGCIQTPLHQHSQPFPEAAAKSRRLPRVRQRSCSGALTLALSTHTFGICSHTGKAYVSRHTFATRAL